MGAVGDEHAEMEDISDSELSHHVREALKSVLLGDTDDYDHIVGNMHNNKRLGPDEVAMLVTILRGLSGAVSYIDVVHHRILLSSICNMSLWNYGPDVMDALIELVVALATSNGKYVDLCLDMLVCNFIPPINFLEILKQPRGLAKKDQILGRVHSALKGIADLVPLAPSRLEQIVRERVPSAHSKDAQIVVYVEAMLLLEGGDMGELVGNTMIFELMNRLIDLDVEIGWDEILLDDPNKGIFEMELEDMARSVNETEIDMEDEPVREYSGRKVLWGNVVAQKLDTLMVLAFDHLGSCFKSGRLVKVFETLLQSFQSTVLNAYKSKFAQFVMFYACSLDPEDCGTQFVSRLVEIFGSTVYPQDWRMSAVCYLASYLARAKFLSASYVTTVLESLVGWCYNYCENQIGGIHPKHHRVFYAGCQAIMYVLCFRLRSILAIPPLKSQLVNMPLEQILKHSLNPLEVCLPSIVDEFLRQAKAAHLFRVSGNFAFNDLLESELSRAFGGFERLDLFFPFDPYLLRKSDRFIRPNFIYWSMVRTTYDDDDDDESISDENEAEDGGRGPMSFEDDEFDMNLNKMSITPRNSFMFGNEQHRKMQMPSRIRPSTSPESL
ncbi:RNA polymerase I-specific transcription initiation factor rrn3 [Cynara cardunculus var. scolymus]|uniref:RNA polymerase I-specific transcription initiation factor rrn3 n=1 Tax=Cynara cardunculus var. scolymus TaxID=59895 RepID=UPI000D629B23|nr:RNA polymerase I-specific transcription initiation factor rrn3 [Cynara cardunculus var. scolymus]